MEQTERLRAYGATTNDPVHMIGMRGVVATLSAYAKALYAD
jgi:hypothetical protein